MDLIHLKHLLVLVRTKIPAEAKRDFVTKRYNRSNSLGNERRSQASRNDIRRHHRRHHEASRIHIHPRQRLDNLTTPQHQASADQQIRRDAKAQINDMRRRAMAGQHDLGKGVRARRVRLDLDGDDGEEQDLERAHAAVPHAAAQPVLVRKGRRCEERGGPGPGRDDAGGDEAGLDAAGGGVEFFRLAGLVGSIAVLQVCEAEPGGCECLDVGLWGGERGRDLHEDGKEGADANDYPVADSGGEDLKF